MAVLIDQFLNQQRAACGPDALPANGRDGITPGRKLMPSEVRITLPITLEEAREVWRFDAETGFFYWKVNPARGPRVLGTRAGSLRPDGYRHIRFRKKTYYEHRLGYFFDTGVWPEDQVDHFGEGRSDNRPDKLREADAELNNQNQIRAHKDNKSGFLGVVFDEEKGKWRATIRVKGIRIHIGYYDTPELASEAYIAKKRELHKGNML